MANLPRRPENPNDTPPPDAVPTYTVGYGQPPLHTLFKPGHTKRGGRKKGQRNARTALDGILSEKVTLREGNRPRVLSKRDAMFLRITNAAVSGNDKAQSKVIALMHRHRLDGEPHETTEAEPFTGDDPALIADFLRRHGNQVESTQSPGSNGKPVTGKAEPASQQTKETKS
jgi:Family of unknown function (DUF5681)